VIRRFRANARILGTPFETREGEEPLIDFMQLRSAYANPIRIVKGERGRVVFHSDLILSFAYCAIVSLVTQMDDTSIRSIASPDVAVMRSCVGMRGENF